MKKLIALCLAFAALPIFAQVTVDEKNVDLDGRKNGMVIYVPFGTKDEVEKSLKNEMKSWKGNFKGGKIMSVDDGKLKILTENTFDAWGKVEENSDGGCDVSIAIDLGGAMLSSKDHPGEYKAMETRMRQFAIDTAKDVVGDEVKEEEKILTDKEKELEDLEKDKENMEKEIEDWKKKIEENEKKIEENKSLPENKKGEIDEQKNKVIEVEKKKEAIK